MKPLAGVARFNVFYVAIFVVVGIASLGLLTTQYFLYSIIPAISILLFLLLGKFPAIGYYAIVFLIPFGAFRGRLPWIIAALVILILSLKFLFEKRLIARLQSQMWPWFLIFLLINFISSLLSRYSQYAIPNVRLLVAAYVFFAVSLIILSQKDFVKILPVILISSVSLSSFLGIIGYVFELPFFLYTGVTEITGRRAAGGSVDANILGLMINFCIPLFVHRFFRTPGFKPKILTGILVVTNITALVTTYSRGAAVVFAITVFFLILFNARKIKPVHLGFIVMATAILVTMILIFTPASYWERQKSMTDTVGDRAVSRRLSYYTVAWDALKKHMLLGTGTETFRYLFAESDVAPKYARKGMEVEISLVRDAHNTYTEIIVGTGILGFSVFLIIIWKTYKSYQSAYKQFKLRGNEELASMVRTYQISFLSLASYLVIFSDPYQKYFLLSLALSQLALRFSQEATEEQYNGNIIPVKHAVV